MKVKPDDTKKKTPHQTSILGGTSEWNIEVDLGKRIVFPDMVQTTLRPDIVLWSKTGKNVIVIELTVS